MKTPKRLTPRKPRTHLPSLNPLEMEAFQQRLDALIGVSAAGKTAVMQSMRAAANPDAELPLMVIKTLSREEQERIAVSMKALHSTMGAMTKRGKQGLLNMNDEEWQKVVDGIGE